MSWIFRRPKKKRSKVRREGDFERLPLDPKTMKNDETLWFSALKIWVTTSKNEGCGFPGWGVSGKSAATTIGSQVLGKPHMISLGGGVRMLPRLQGLCTLPETNIVPARKPSQKETCIPGGYLFFFPLFWGVVLRFVSEGSNEEGILLGNFATKRCER